MPCPEDIFERLQKSYHEPEEYNHIIAKILHELCNTASTTEIVWSDGIPYLLDPDRGKLLSLPRPIITGAYYGKNQASRYLRISGVATAGEQGFYIPRDATITAMWAKSRSVGNWILEVRRNGIAINLAAITINIGAGSDTVLDLDVDAGDCLQLRLNGSGVDHPIASVEIAWRLVI